MRRLFTMTALAMSLTAVMAADPKAKKGLQDLSEFVGQWNLTADSKSTGKLVSWKETINISWKFKGDDAWLNVDIKDGKKDRSGDFRFDPEKRKYTLKLTGKDKVETVWTGELKKGKLTLESKDEKSSDVTRMTINTVSEGIRLSVVTEVQKGGSGPFETLAKAAGNKEGESLAGSGSKKPECIVTGGTATMTVSYMGKTYYVCCSGCRDEFNENPKKYIDAAEKAKK